MKSWASLATLLLGAVGLVCGCSQTGTTATPGATDGGVEAAVDAAPPVGSYTLQFGPIQVAPSEENTQCLVLRLGNVAPIHVGAIHNLLGTSSHHMIVYRVNDTVEVKTPFNCQPFTDTLNPAAGSALMVSQKKDDLLTFPPGVAYTLDANQMIRIEMHYINPTAATTTLVSTTTMIPIADSAFKYEADFLFIGDPDIRIPPNSKMTLGPVNFPVPAQFAGVNFFAITGHEHKLGTNVLISTTSNASMPAASSPDLTPVYDVPDWLWSEPATVSHDPPFQLPAGGGLQFTCEWDNTTQSQVSFGESANDEMCFFWAYYYPSIGGARVCFHTDMVAGGYNLCCPGDAACDLVEKYLGVNLDGGVGTGDGG